MESTVENKVQIIDGKLTATQIRQEIAAEVQEMLKVGDRPPHLAAILVGNDGASETYVNSKVNDCKEVGFTSSLFRYDANVTEEELLGKIKEINADDNIDGLIVQLPLPEHISEKKVTETIDPKKDVDGFHPMNVGKMVLNLPTFISATPYGILLLLEKYGIETSGKDCVVVGRSNIVGRPMSILLSRSSNLGNCTVTVCHSRTKNMAEITRKADIIVAAIGKPEFITADMVKEGAVVIDVGLTRVESSETRSGFKLKGDVKFDEVAKKCSFITPVPGGVGPMTRVALLMNTLKSSKKTIYS